MAYKEFSFTAHDEIKRTLTRYADIVYLNVRDAETANDDVTMASWVGQAVDGVFYVYRSPLIFTTSDILSGAPIEYASLTLKYSHDNSNTDFDIVVQNGQPTYPSNPPV